MGAVDQLWRWRHQRLPVVHLQAEDGIRDTSVTGVQTCALPIYDDLVEETTRLGGSGRMAGVVFVLEFLELVLVFPDEDLGFGEDAGLEVGVDDAGLAFGGGGATQGVPRLASVVTGGGELLLGAHKITSLAGLEACVPKRKGQPGGTALFDHYCSRRTLGRTGERTVSH